MRVALLLAAVPALVSAAPTPENLAPADFSGLSWDDKYQIALHWNVSTEVPNTILGPGGSLDVVNDKFHPGEDYVPVADLSGVSPVSLASAESKRSIGILGRLIDATVGSVTGFIGGTLQGLGGGGIAGITPSCGGGSGGGSSGGIGGWLGGLLGGGGSGWGGGSTGGCASVFTAAQTGATSGTGWSWNGQGFQNADGRFWGLDGCDNC